MKHADLADKLKALGYWDTGKGTRHEKWTNGNRIVWVPRHREIKEFTAKGILKEASKP